MRDYNTIYVDPPLALGAINLAGLRDLPVRDFCVEDALLFLWSPAMELPEYLRLMEAWDFAYVQLWSWLRGAVNNKYPYEHLVEHLLVGVRGTVRIDFLLRRNLFDCGPSEGAFHPQSFKGFALAAATRAFSPPRPLDMFGFFWHRRDSDYWGDGWTWWEGSLKY
jgi:MT-A70